MLKGKNIIVTGSRRGIGRSVVEKLSENGANIWACAREEDQEFEDDMRELGNKYQVAIWPIYFDLTDEMQIKKAVSDIKKIDSKIDGLVNVAGMVNNSNSFTMSSLKHMKQVFDVNFFGLSILTQYVSRLMMRNRSGNIINISSVAGLDGEPAQYEYAASKAAVNGATKQLARELWQYGIRVNAIAPGVIDTDMGRQVDEVLLKKTLNKVIMGRIGKKEEIANVVLFLASDLSSYMTGQIIRVDGGM